MHDHPEFATILPVLGLLTLLFTGLLILWLAGVLFTAWMLTHPPRRTYGGAVARGQPGDPSEIPSGSRVFESWTFRSRGLELPVWDIPGDAVSGPVVVTTSGWADSRIGGLLRLSPFLAAASRVILWELPGHGEAPGICRLGTSEVQDLTNLIEQLGANRVALFGWSLGAGVSIAATAQLGAMSPVVAIVAETPYRLPRTPARNVMRLRGLPESVLIDPAFTLLRLILGPGICDANFDRARFARGLHCPVLVVHGETDEVTPVDDGKAIAAACTGELFVVPGGGHNDLWTDQSHASAATAKIAAFLRSITAAPGPPQPPQTSASPA